MVIQTHRNLSETGDGAAEHTGPKWEDNGGIRESTFVSFHCKQASSDPHVTHASGAAAATAGDHEARMAAEAALEEQRRRRLNATGLGLGTSGGGCDGDGGTAGWSRWSYVAIARRIARRRAGRCMTMLVGATEERELAPPSALPLSPMPTPLVAPQRAPAAVFAALGLLRRRRSRPPPPDVPSPPDCVTGVLRFLQLSSRKRARPHPEDTAPTIAAAVGGGASASVIPGAVLEALGTLTRCSKRCRKQPTMHVAHNPDDLSV
jgi:hypothetical protein